MQPTTTHPAVHPPLLILPALALAIGLGVIYLDTWSSMVAVWKGSESFAHGFVVAPISLWMIWRQREEILAQPVTPCWPALAAVAACGAAWMLGRLAGVNSVEQFAVVGAIPALVLLAFGWRIFWSMVFPLTFLFFAVPFGNFLLPVFMEWTADFTVLAVRASGVPILRDGLTFTLPSGRWSVVESCSGLRYLLAALPLACVYAFLNYRSPWRRLLFIGSTIVISIVANWIRAYLIVMIGHLSGMKIAVGVDHLVYGWLFFGIVMAISFWAGSFWTEEPAAAPARTSTSRPGSSPRSVRPVIAAAVLGIASLALWPASAGMLLDREVPVAVDLKPIRAALAPDPRPRSDDTFRPDYGGGLDEAFGRSQAHPDVNVLVVQYANQSRTTEMIREANRVLPGGTDNGAWQIQRSVRITPAAGEAPLPAREVTELLVSGPDGTHLVWHWFWVNGHTLTSSIHVKLQTARDLLAGKGDESLAWFIWTPAGDSLSSARARLVAEAQRLGRVAPGNR